MDFISVSRYFQLHLSRIPRRNPETMVQMNRNKLFDVLWVIFEYIVLNFIDGVISSCKNISGILSIMAPTARASTPAYACEIT